jgi:hypothetical protein
VERWAISLEDVVIDPLGVQVRGTTSREEGGRGGIRRKEETDGKGEGKRGE